MKWFLRIALIVVVALALLAGGTYWYFDSLTRRAVSEGVTYATRTPTTVDEASLSPWAGRLGVSGVTVANPALDGKRSFSTPHFLKLGEGRFAFDWATAFSETMRMPELVIQDLDLYLEQQGDQSNHQIILERVKRLAGPEKKRPDKAQKFVIDHILIKNVTVTLRGYPGGDREVNLAQPIELKDVGSETEKGVIAAEVTGVILQAVFKSVLVDVASLPESLISEMGPMLENLQGFDPLGEQLLEETGQVWPGIGDILGGGNGNGRDAGTQPAGEAERKPREGLGTLLNGDKQKQSGNEQSGNK